MALKISITFSRGHLADPVTVQHDELSISLLGHCEEQQRTPGDDWWLFGRRPFSFHRRRAGSRYRHATTAIDITISTNH